MHCSQFLADLQHQSPCDFQPYLNDLATLQHQTFQEFQLCLCEKHFVTLQVLALCEKKREPPLEYIIVDTPGQIEIFTWSASGAIITEAFAAGVLPWLLLRLVLSASLAGACCQLSHAWGSESSGHACCACCAAPAVPRLLCRACCAAPAVPSLLYCRACCTAAPAVPSLLYCRACSGAFFVISRFPFTKVWQQCFKQPGCHIHSCSAGFPTMVAFVIDTPRCTHPQTFMSNMLQVCGCLMPC